VSGPATGYAARAATYAAEVTVGLTAPQLLGHLLRPGMIAAEIPSGAGHYPRVYADAGCPALLIDASAEMRDAAAVNATGLPNVRCLQSRLETLTADVVLADLIVVPNGAPRTARPACSSWPSPTLPCRRGRSLSWRTSTCSPAGPTATRTPP